MTTKDQDKYYTKEEIAAMLKVKPSYVSSKNRKTSTIYDPTFPTPIPRTRRGKGAKNYWIKEEVHEWMKKQQQT